MLSPQNQFDNTSRNTGNMSRSSQVAGKIFWKQDFLFLFIGLNSIGTSLSGYSSVSGIPSYVLQRLGIEGPVTNKVFVANVSD